MAIKTPENIEEVKSDISNDQKVGEVNVLYFDASSTCTGYSIMKVNFENKTAKLKSSGAIWLNKKDWRDQEKYSYMFHAISNYFWIVENIDYIVMEQYSINPKKMLGVQILPELAGVIKAAGEENGVNVASILPQTWRAQIGIKPIVTQDKNGKNKRDYKTPTRDKILEHYDIPDKSISNITGKERTTPSDVYDAIAIGLGWCKKYGIKVLFEGESSFNDHIGVLSDDG